MRKWYILPPPPPPIDIEAKVKELDAATKATKIAGQIATRELIKAGQLTAEEIAAIVELYPAWAVGVTYAAGDLVSHEGGLYECIQPHTAQADWKPPDVPALWKRHTPEDEIADWVQPQGAHDAYQPGDKVRHNGQVWVCVAENNVWEPGVYGWEVVE